MMNELRSTLQSRVLLRACRGLFVSAVLALVVHGCSDAAKHDEPGEHDHAHGETEHSGDGHEQEGPAQKTDAHHVAEAREHCEDDVVLSADALVRYGIEVAPASNVMLVPKVPAPGHLAFPQGGVARVGSAVAGRIVDVRVRPGDEVEKDAVLLVLESPALGEAQSEYLQKRTVAMTAQPSLDLARSAYDRAKQLYECVQGVALSEVQRREADLRQLERDLEVARSAQAASRSRLTLLGMRDEAVRALEDTKQIESRFSIVAPIRGRIVELSVTLGELVDPSRDRLLVIGDLSTLWAIAEVSEARLSEIAMGALARVRIPALDNATYEGRVTAVPSVMEASTRTAEVRVDVPNPSGALLPGMFIQVEIDSSRGSSALTLAVPDGAVMTVEGRPSVFVPIAANSGVFCKHEIEVGEPVGALIPVLAGLSAGDLVVVSGTFRLKAEHGKASAAHEH